MRWVLLAMTVSLAGCAVGGFHSGHAPSQASAAAPLQRCAVQPAQWAVGKTNTAQHVEEARRRSGALMARVLRQGQAATADHDVQRLNLQVDSTGRILAATCG